MANKAMVDEAYEVIQKHSTPVPFLKLFDAVCKKKGIADADKERYISDFYTQLTLDGRFLSVVKNGKTAWDLRLRHTTKEVKEIDLSDVFQDDDEEEAEALEKDEKEDDEDDENDVDEDEDDEDDEPKEKNGLPEGYHYEDDD